MNIFTSKKSSGETDEIWHRNDVGNLVRSVSYLPLEIPLFFLVIEEFVPMFKSYPVISRGNGSEGYEKILRFGMMWLWLRFSKKSPTGPTERTPKPDLISPATYCTSESVGKVPFNVWWILGYAKSCLLRSDVGNFIFTSWMVRIVMSKWVRGWRFVSPMGNDQQMSNYIDGDWVLESGWFVYFLLPTVDGWNPAPVEVGSLSHYLQDLIHSSVYHTHYCIIHEICIV